jgi:DNA-binding NtrC family response regulator
MTTFQILICGDEPQLLTTREMVLSRAGYRVVSPCTAEEIDAVPEFIEVDLAVLGHSISEGQQKTVVSRILSRWPSVKILYLTRTNDALEQLSDSEFECGVHNPPKLISNCQHILEGLLKDRPSEGNTLISAHEQRTPSTNHRR